MVMMTMITNPVNVAPLSVVGKKRKKNKVIILKKVAHAKCTTKTNTPWGQIPLTPLPNPKPAAQSGSRISPASNALGK